MNCPADIPKYSFVSAVFVAKGMSSDEKYRVTLLDGRCCLLRISDPGQYERKRSEFDMMRKAFDCRVPVSEPYAFGQYADGRIYQLTQWLDGCDLEAVVSTLSTEESYRLGMKAAALLKKLHAIPAPVDIEPWKVRFCRKIAIRTAEAEEEFGLTENLSRLCEYLAAKADLLDRCPQCFHHGDYNPGNLILLDDGSLAAIDFNAYNLGCGDPVFEAATILLDDSVPGSFKEGFKTAYFSENSPENLEQLLDYYKGYSFLAQLCEAEDAAAQEKITIQIESFLNTHIK